MLSADGAVGSAGGSAEHLMRCAGLDLAASAPIARSIASAVYAHSLTDRGGARRVAPVALGAFSTMGGVTTTAECSVGSHRFEARPNPHDQRLPGLFLALVARRDEARLDQHPGRAPPGLDHERQRHESGPPERPSGRGPHGQLAIGAPSEWTLAPQGPLLLAPRVTRCWQPRSPGAVRVGAQS